MGEQIQSVIQKHIEHLYPGAYRAQLSKVGGGCINECYKVAFSEGQVFCKVNDAARYPLMFQKESNGLEMIKKHGAIKVPDVIDCFESGGKQTLLLQWVDEGQRTEAFWKKFGEQLAALHHITAGTFGLGEDNYMGSVPQRNQPHNNWSDFFVNERLKPLVNQCSSKNLLSANHVFQFEKLYLQIGQLFESDAKASLVHGDLWNGNFMCNENEEPVLIDQAIYFGHRSVDVAMTTLFGGFRSQFYDAYNYHFPLPTNYEEQWEICNLYPLLIHLLLFGKSYLSKIERSLAKFAR